MGSLLDELLFQDESTLSQSGANKKVSLWILEDDIIRPATIAVIIPFSGVTPLAIPKAIANGNATIPTMIPAMRSVINCLRL